MFKNNCSMQSLGVRYSKVRIQHPKEVDSVRGGRGFHSGNSKPFGGSWSQLWEGQSHRR